MQQCLLQLNTATGVLATLPVCLAASYLSTCWPEGYLQLSTRALRDVLAIV